VRPVHLTTEGFAAFRDRIEVEFDGAEFFALIGPTGSGKSSVVDAICFALYGAVPRYEDERMVAPAITIGSQEARVALEFEVGGERYVATRVVRRQPRGGATTREARLERVLDTGTDVLAGTADEVRRAVEELLGLPFDHFTKCVVLPQGEFARFLHDKPAARQDLLAKLLNLGTYTSVGERARQLAEIDKSNTRLQRNRLDDLAFATPEAEEAARARVREVGALRAQLHDVAPQLEQLEARIREYRQEADDAARMAAALGKIAVPAAVARQAETLAELETAAGDAAEAYERAVERQEVAEKRVAALPALGSLQAAAQAHGQLAACQKRLHAAMAERDAAEATENAATKALNDADVVLRRAEDALDAARTEHAAHDLAAHLVKGEPCPVCLQPVAAVPQRDKPADLRKAEEARDSARQALEQARSTQSRATQETSKVGARIGELEEQQTGLAAIVASWPDANALRARIAEVTAATADADAARADVAAARKRERDARRSAKECADELDKSWRVFDTQRDAVVGLDPPKPSRQDLAGDWKVLAEWAQAQRPRQEEQSRTATGLAAQAAETLDVQLRALVDACAAIGVETDITQGLSGVRERVAGAETEAKGQLERVQHAAKEARRLTEEIAVLEEEAAVAAQLGQLLNAQGFERWLVAEALDSLVLGASDTLGRLSSGQYALTRDERNEFLVVDHANADETRLAKTLSGGETFQASLALALALADQLSGLAADGAAKLDSIFLDEGFGTLDPETLNVVADTIENLGQEDRMVGVITHVKELADRIPVRFQVTKGPRTSTVERVSG